MKKYLSILLALLLTAAILTGCGSSKSAASGAAAYENAAMADMAPMEAAQALADGTGDSGTEASLPESRKWIITIDLSAETDDLDALNTALNAKIDQLQGYVENQSIYNGSGTGQRYRSASLTVRIPADKAEAFTQDVAGLANIVRKSKNVEDVTLNYVATENRLKALQTEETRLLELLSQAENMTDLLAIEDRLTQVRYELENAGSQKRLYDNQIDYATIYLSIDEVQEYTPVEEPGLWERISKGFSGSLKGVGEDLVDLLVWLIVSLPYLVVLALGVGLVILIGRPIRRRAKARKAAKNQKKEDTAENT